MSWKKLYSVLLPIIATALAGQFGYTKVQEYRAQSAPTEVTVNVETGDNDLRSKVDALSREVEANRKSIVGWHGEL